MSAECSAGNIPPGYKQTEVGVIPEDWNIEPLRCDVTLFSGQHVLVQHCNTSGDGVPYLTGPADFPNGKIQQTKFTNRPTTLCKAGDILVTVKGSGSGTLVEADNSYCISRQLMAIRVKEWNAKFLFYFLLYNASKIKTSSTGLIPGLSRFDILDQEIPLPPTLAEQEAIAEALSDADALIESLEQLIAKKRQIKQGAMQELLTGNRRLPGFATKAGYKQAEVGMIPEDWEVKPMAELFDFQNGVNADKSSYGIGTPFINVLEVITHSTLTETRIPGKVSLSAQSVATFAVQHGDILFNRTSETQEELGLTSVYIGNEVVVFGGFVIRARPKDSSLDSIFTSYVLRSPAIRSQIMARGQGAVRANIGQQDLSRVLVILPSKAEQEAIATILSDMDSEITALEEKLAKARQIKQGMMQELLTGRIRLI